MKKLMIVALMLTLGMGLSMAQNQKTECTKTSTTCVSKTPCDDCKGEAQKQCGKDAAAKHDCKGEAKQHCSKDAATAPKKDCCKDK